MTQNTFNVFADPIGQVDAYHFPFVNGGSDAEGTVTPDSIIAGQVGQVLTTAEDNGKVVTAWGDVPPGLERLSIYQLINNGSNNITGAAMMPLPTLPFGTNGLVDPGLFLLVWSYMLPVQTINSHTLQGGININGSTIFSFPVPFVNDIALTTSTIAIDNTKPITIGSDLCFIDTQLTFQGGQVFNNTNPPTPYVQLGSYLYSTAWTGSYPAALNNILMGMYKITNADYLLAS